MARRFGGADHNDRGMHAPPVIESSPVYSVQAARQIAADRAKIRAVALSTDVDACPMTQTHRYDLPDPHVVELTVEDAEIDAYQHVNNAVYVTWCDRAAWDHSAALGLPLERCLEIDRGMAVVRTVIRYFRSAVKGDAVHVATWLLPSDNRLCIRRRFQALRTADGETLCRAEIEYACIELSSGRPVRWPQEFRAGYVPAQAVVAAVCTLAPI